MSVSVSYVVKWRPMVLHTLSKTVVVSVTKTLVVAPQDTKSS